MLSPPLLTVLFVPLVLAGSYTGKTATEVPATNCTGAAKGKSFDWWLSSETQSNPCQVLQLLFQQCDPDYRLPYMGLSAADAVDKCVESREGRLAPCCCSTQAYALQQACWSCQNNGEPYPTDDRPTLRQYINCTRNLYNWQEVYKEIDMPGWAGFGINLDDIWMLDQTKKLAMKIGNILAHKDGDDDDDKIEPFPSRLTVASVVGSLCGLAGLACALAIALVIRRRRRRMFAGLQPHGKDRVPAWFGRSSAYVSIDSGSQTRVDRYSKEIPSAPKPTLGRGRLSGNPSLISSWRRNVAKEPYLPRASNTLESRDFDRSTTTVSMIRSETESRRSVDSDESFSNSQSRPPTVISRATHAFSV